MELTQSKAEPRPRPARAARGYPVGRPNAPRSAGSSRLVVAHFVAATLYLLAGALGLVWIAPDIAHGMYLAPRVAGITHLFTLGWLTLTILGALSQLLPMALGAPLRSKRVAHLALWTLIPGVAVFAAGVTTATVSILVPGVVLVAGGVSIAVGHTAATLVRGRTRDVTWNAIAIGLGFLAATLAFGLLLAVNLQTGFAAVGRVRILAAHIHVALIGWAFIIVVGASRRLMPTFLVAHTADARWSGRALAAFTLGVPLLALGLVAANPVLSWSGATLLDLGMAAFLWQAWRFYRARTRARLDVGMRFALAGLPCFGAAAILGSLLLALGASHSRLATAYVVTGLLGGFVPFVTGIVYEIVPTLAWTARYAGRLSRGRIPTVAQMYSERLAMVQLAALACGVALILAGIAASTPRITRVGALFFVTAVMILLYQMARMWWDNPSTPQSSPKPQ